MSEEEIQNAEPLEPHRSDEAEEICYPDGRIEHPGVRHEPRDIRFRPILALMALVCAILAALGYTIWRFYWFQAAAQEEVKASPYPLAPGLSAPLPPKPRLEQLDRMAAVESSDVFKRLAAKEKVLNSYGATVENGFVHIPIQQAIKTVAGSLPAKGASQGGAAHDNGLLEAGESNSGRMFRGPQS
jgi:hypothetical protein